MNVRRSAWINMGVLLIFATASHGIDIGQSIEAIRLVTLDGDAVTLNRYDDRRGTAVVFLSGRCEETEKAIQTINRVHEKFRLRGVLFVGVCSNNQESGEELRTFCQRRGVRFPVFRDADRAVAELLGATTTPQAFLIDQQAKVVYRGRVDGLEAAITEMRQDRPIEKPLTKAMGTPIDRPGPKREVVDPYGSLSFSSELVFERIPAAPAHHCSTITELPNGQLLCVWYGGSYESANDQKLFMSWRNKGERSWSPPQVVIRNPGQPPGNAVVFVDGQQRVWIVWGRMESPRPLRRGGGWDQCRLMFRVSTDNGRSWSEDRVLNETVGWLVRNVPIRRKNGALLLPVSGRVDGGSGSFFLQTADEGKTWMRSGVIRGGSQPTVIERADGSLLALMRAFPRILRSTSPDGGTTWETPRKTTLKNPGAGIAMTQLRNGHVVLVFNDSQTDRSPLSIGRSLDGGETWEPPLQLESNPGEYSYPCVIQTADGKIHVTYTFRRYTIKHVEMNEDWLIHDDRPN